MEAERKDVLDDRNQVGSVLIMVLFMCLLLAGSAMFLLTRTHAEVRRQMGRRIAETALQNAISAMHAGQVHVNASNYVDGQNRVLWSKDDSDNSIPGGRIFLADWGSVQVNNLGDGWFELLAVGVASNNFVGEIRRYVKYRVHEVSSMSDNQIYAENGNVVISDTDIRYGRVHVNTYLRCRNMVPGLGAKFYELVSAGSPPKDYAEYGGAAELEFHGPPPVWDAARVEMPDVTAFNDLKQVAEDNTSGLGLWDTTTFEDAAKIWIGDKGIEILPTGLGINKLELHFDKNWDAAKGTHQEVTIHIWDSNNTERTKTLDVPLEAVIFSQRRIDGIQGDIYGRMTVVCETGQVELSDDILYVDEYGRHPYEYDPSIPEQPDNFVMRGGEDYPEPYTGNACLAVIAKRDVLMTGRNGDRDLIIMGVFASGVGGADMDGAVRWLWWGTEYGYNRIMRDLRIYGSIISDGYGGWAYFKGWTSGGVPAGGYNNSVFRYDPNLVENPPAHFLQIQQPEYRGWQLMRGGFKP